MNTDRSRRVSIPAVSLFLLFAILVPTISAQDTFEDRKAWLLDQVREASVDFGEAKIAMPVVCARLYETNGTDPDALNRTSIAADFNDRFFRMLGQVRAYYLAKDNFSASQLTSLKNIITGDPNWRNTGTENHRLMVWTSGYLFAQAFPDETWNWIENDVASQLTSEELMEKLLELIIIRGQWRFSGGNSEFLSPNYDTFSVAAMANLYDFAEDPVARDIADAFLHYHVGQMALGSEEGYILAPNSRYADQGQRTELSIAQWIPWLYWGWNNPVELEPGDRYIIYLALSSWRPSPVIDMIGNKDFTEPFTVRTQQPHWQRSPLRYVVRTTYRDLLYSVSSGVIRHVPGAFQLDDSHFSIAYSTNDEKRFIEAFHPYWRTKSQGDDYWRGPTSPFQQSIQQENTAILLYSIPEKDPWKGVGQWAGERNEDLTQLAQVRVSKAVAERVTEDPWYFFREGDVYIGIRSLREGSTFTRFHDNEASQLFMFDVIRSEAADTGFIFEVGDAAEFGTFEEFQAQLKSNPLTIDWDALEVTYTNSRGDELKIRYNTSLETPDGSIPTSWINGRRIDHVNWPFIESPWLNLTGRVMTLEQDGDWKRIDWSGDLPVITEGSGPVAPRLLVRYTIEGEVDAPLDSPLEFLHEATSFSAEDLPAGLAIDTDTGVISGTPEQSGEFTATITAANEAGSSSEAVSFRIDGPPSITAAIHTPSVDEGQPATFTVEATSLGELGYQWFKDGTLIPGATESEFVIESATPADDAIYTVQVTNSFATITSAELPLTVVPEPAGDTLLDLFPDALDNGDGWYQLPAIGWVFDEAFPIILHTQHGYWWAAGDPETGYYFFDFTMQSWLYTNTGLYPFFYRFAGGNSSYLLYLEEIWSADAGGRWFFDYNPAVFDYVFIEDAS
jgi:hypothetical protein